MVVERRGGGVVWVEAGETEGSRRGSHACAPREEEDIRLPGKEN